MEYVNLKLLPTPKKEVEIVDPKVKGFKAYRVVKEELDGADVSVCSFSKNGNLFAVNNSMKIQLWELESMKQICSFERFKDIVTCASFRDDGKLILAGDGSGKTSVLNVEGKTTLKRLRGHKGAVTAAMFVPNTSMVVTGGKDKTIRVWDITSTDELEKWEAHKDSIKCIARSPVDDMAFASASYDGSIKFWDIREKPEGDREPVMTLDHGFPVESICYFPSGLMLLSAGSTTVKVWDLLKGVLVAEFGDCHGRTITSVSIDKLGETCLTTSLDSTAKAWDASSFTMLHSYILPKPALSGQWSPESSGYIIGLAGGWQARRRKKLEAERATEKKKPATGSARFYKRGKYEKPEEGDVVIERKRRAKQSLVDYYLRKFEIRKALVACFQDGREKVVWAFLDEMIQRGCLRKCLEDLNQASHIFILQWCLSHFPPEPSVRNLYLDFLNTLLERKEFQQCSSPAVMDMIRRLDLRVNEELGQVEKLQPLFGMLDAVLVA